MIVGWCRSRLILCCICDGVGQCVVCRCLLLYVFVHKCVGCGVKFYGCSVDNFWVMFWYDMIVLGLCDVVLGLGGLVECFF